MITLTVDNYKTVKKYIDISEYDLNLLQGILVDLLSNNHGVFHKPMEICFNIEHTEYSPEWTEPMPDFYGSFCIKYTDSTEMIGDWIADVHELDNIMFFLYEAFAQTDDNSFV